MNISYKYVEKYLECPKGLKYDLDKTPTMEKKNGAFTVYGTVIQAFFEYYCNAWRRLGAMNRDQIQSNVYDLYLKTVKEYELFNLRILGKSEADIIEDVCNDVETILNSENAGFFSEGTKSEIDFRLKFPNGHNLTCRVDFIRETKDGILIFDGKGVKDIKKGVSNNQLLFYALMYFHTTGILPEKLGFFYYKYNSMYYIPFDKEILNVFRVELSQIFLKICAGNEFEATPSPRSCRYCLYTSQCNEYREFQKTRPKRTKLPHTITESEDGPCGF